MGTLSGQKISGIEPIVLQAVAYLLPDPTTQRDAIDVIVEFTQKRQSVADPITHLALLYYSNGDVEKLRKSAWQSHPHFWMDEIVPIFRTMKDAQEWVWSLSNPQH